MEPRKIQRVGSSTLSISIPRKLVKKLGLKQGDLFYIQDCEDGSIKVVPRNSERKPSYRATVLNADLCANEGMLKRIIMGNYILGTDLITISSFTRLQSKHIKEIREATQSLMGVGIMEETMNHITVQCSIDPTNFPMETSIFRLFQISSTMHQEAINAFVTSDIQMAEEVKRRKGEANTMFWALSRLLSLAQEDQILAMSLNINDLTELHCYRSITICLERISTWSEIIAQKVIEIEPARASFGKHLVERVEEISESVRSLCQVSINCLSTKDIMKANNVIQTYCEIQKVEERFLKAICTYSKLKSKFFSVDRYFLGEDPPNPCAIAQLSLIVWSLRRIAEIGSEIADFAIQHALSRNKEFSRTTTCNVIQNT